MIIFSGYDFQDFQYWDDKVYNIMTKKKFFLRIHPVSEVTKIGKGDILGGGPEEGRRKWRYD